MQLKLEDIRSEPSAVALDAWRLKATDMFALVLLFLYVPSFLRAFFEPSINTNRLTMLAVGLILVSIAAFARGLSVPARIACIIIMQYSLAALGIDRVGVASHARTTLLIMPFMIMILVGIRAGLAIMVANVTMLVGLFYVIEHTDFIRTYAPWKNGEWRIQTLLTISSVIPPALLMTSFVRFIMQSIKSEHQARESLNRGEHLRQCLERDLIDVSERECHKVSRELHDGVCQDLTGIMLTVRNIQRKSNSLAPENSIQLDMVVEDLGQVITQARNLIWTLNPINRNDTHFQDTLGELVNRIQGRTEIRIVYFADGQCPAMPEQVALHLYRIAQEALSNAIHHSGGQQILLRLEADSDGISLTIEDDGKGLPACPQERGGLGLKSMAWRAGQIGSELILGKGTLRGAAVTCRVPALFTRNDTGGADDRNYKQSG